MKKLTFTDRLVPYDSFVKDVAARVAMLLESDSKDPVFISQRKAYAMFGRANVERWRREGKVQTYRRPGKLEYRTAELRAMQRISDDFTGESP